MRRFHPTAAFVSVILTAAFSLTTLQGCATPSRMAAVPRESVNEAEIPGLSGVRYYIDGNPVEMIRDGWQAIKQEKAYLAASGNTGPLPPAVFLAISGGGDDGAFGAGLLAGWTAAGTRPVFKAVTGISTGALTAPFAFLGPAYDDTLREVYTNVSQRDILKRRNLLAALFNDALADNTPLWRLIKHHITPQLLSAIAAEHARGRLLLIGTTDLDSRRGVIWNMGKIAASGHPRSLELFQSILIASSAIPGAFPPVLIDVEAHGKHYQEMHVDGGAVAQVFAYPPSINLEELSKKYDFQRERTLYIIRNGRLDPQYAEVERRTLSIAARAISSLIHSQGVGDLYRLYLTSQRDGVFFNLAFIPSSFNFPHKEDFDTAYMRRLFDTGYDLAVKGYPWAKAPPEYDAR